MSYPFLEVAGGVTPWQKKICDSNDLSLKARKAGCPRANKHRGNMCVCVGGGGGSLPGVVKGYLK